MVTVQLRITSVFSSRGYSSKLSARVVRAGGGGVRLRVRPRLPSAREIRAREYAGEFWVGMSVWASHIPFKMRCDPLCSAQIAKQLWKHGPTHVFSHFRSAQMITI